jgi:hypothetical protein
MGISKVQQAPDRIMLREMLRREKRYATAASAAVLGLVLLAFLLLLLGIIWVRDAIAGLFCCFILPVLIPPSMIAIIYIERYSGLRSMDQLLPLSRYGDVDSLIDQIDSEVVQSSDERLLARLPKTIVDSSSDCTVMTQNWLLHFGRKRLWIIRVDDILWVYKRINVRPSFWVGGRLQFTVSVIADRGRSSEIIVGQEALADQLLAHVIHRRPAILVGYQMAWADLAKDGVTALRSAVREREEHWASLSDDDQSELLEDRLDEASDFVCRYDPRIHGSENPDRWLIG